MNNPHDPAHRECVPDLDRERRIGFSEVIYCPGKSDDQLRAAAESLFGNHDNVLATRANPEQVKILREVDEEVEYNEAGRVAYVHRDKGITGRGTIAVVAAGSCDIPVAEEAACTAEVTGNRVSRIYDVGVAGIHRILQRRDDLENCEVVIVAAGMEGALPSVVGGMTSRPVIAVPTSVGYGTSFNGISALLGMLNSCSPGITVVNIDNGFGAAFAASRINRIRAQDQA